MSTIFGKAQDRLCRGSDEKSTSGLIFSGPCVFGGVIVATDGLSDAVVTIYNNTEASGEKLLPTFTVAAADNLGGCVLPRPIMADKGLYLSITNGKAVVYHVD